MPRWILILIISTSFPGWNVCQARAMVQSPAHADSVPQIRNGFFEQWADARPVGWSVAVGATNGGDKPVSKIRKGPGPSLELSGNARTMAWLSVSQTIAVQPGQSLRLTYEAKTNGVKREGRQFDNCYIALFPKTTDGVKAPPLVWPISSEEFKTESQAVQVANNVASFELLIFLSKTGTLSVKNVKLEASNLKPEDSFDLLVEDMSKHYSFFEHKKVDWNELSDRYRERAIDAETPAAFAKIVARMLDELKDTHISVLLDGRRYSRYLSRTSGSQNFKFVDQTLSHVTDIGKFGKVGKTREGYGYVRIRSLSNVSQDEVAAMTAEISKRLDAPGFILDLRNNSGGSEDVAQDIAGLFTADELVYAKSVRRNGADHADFSKPAARILRPTGQSQAYSGPIVCLIDENTVSSAEGFAMMMNVIPNCTLVGNPTRGASGNPAAIQLPNGVEVWFSRWKSLTPEGMCIEDVGVQPDVDVKPVNGKDAAFEKALQLLSAESAKGNGSE